jgi:hypothetical protein
MANIIIKLVPNKWDSKYFFSFIKKSDKCPKDQHFLAFNSLNREIQAGDYWECFIWDKRETKNRILFKVVPYKQIDKERIKEEKQRVHRFNKMMTVLERFVGEDFKKIVFRSKNEPFLLANTKDEQDLARKYPKFAFLKDKEGILARPVFRDKPVKQYGGYKFKGPRKPIEPRYRTPRPR